MRVCRALLSSTFDASASAKADRMSNIGQHFERRAGTRLTCDRVPQHVHGYYEGATMRSSATLRWYPYKQEVTVADRRVRTVRDAVYGYYFPRELSDDERVKYVSIRSGRSEAEVVAEMYLMRRVRLYAAETVRAVLFGATPRPMVELKHDTLEMRYATAARNAGIELAQGGMTMPFSVPSLVYSPYIDVADCIDAIGKITVREAIHYFFCDVLVHKGIARARLPHVHGDAKPPVAHLEPCLYEFCKLRLAILALISKQEGGYVVDNAYDSGHVYLGCLVHLFPSPHDPRVVTHTVDTFLLDMNLAWAWMQHYRMNYATSNRSSPG